MTTDDKSKKPVAVVTGSSSGIGYETSLLFARNGFFTYATMRSPDKSNKIINLKLNERLSLEVLKLDVNDDKSVKEAIKNIANERKSFLPRNSKSNLKLMYLELSESQKRYYLL
jgi:NAD(P)-dependent dehydrogenase (short-subunit alcohol dehydrogenase family)